MNYKLPTLFLIFILGFMQTITASYADNKSDNSSLSGLDFKLSMPKTEYLSTDKLTLNFTLTNTTNDPITFLKWQTPLENDFTGDLFTVQHKGQDVSYIGKMVKRAAPTEDDFMTLTAGESISGLLDLAEGYAVEKKGDYTIALKQDLQINPTYAEKGMFEMQLKTVATQSATIGFTLNENRQIEVIQEKQANFSSCSSSQKSILNKALIAATELADDSINLIKGATVGTQSLGVHYKTWFGRYTNARYSVVTQHFNKIHDALANQQVTFDCNCASAYRSSFAYVRRNNPYRIHVCSRFWNASLKGRDSKAGTLIHETSHFSVVANTNDHVYGESGVKQLAISRPDKAIANADSHEYFAEDTENMFNQAITNIGITSYRDAANHCSSGYKRISIDLNKGSGGRYIYFCISRNPTWSAISNIRITKNRCPSNYYRYRTDLNRGTTTHDTPLYLCTSRNRNISPITRMKITVGDRSTNICGTLYPYRTRDLNEGAGGKYIYACYN
jgi:peptidyl-Lys metalloendopeptidase